MSRPGFPIHMVEVVTVHSKYHTASNGTEVDGADTHHVRAVHEDKVGGNTPGWPANVQTNDYVRSSASWHQEALTVDGTRTNGDTFWGQWADAFGLGYNPTTDGSRFDQSAEIALVKSRLIGKLIDKIQSNRVNLGEIMFTRSQAANMVADSCKKIASAFTSLKSGNLKGAIAALGGSRGHSGTGGGGAGSGADRIARFAGGIPGQWLALQYGWKPLLSDVYNSLETVRKAWNDTGEWYTVDSNCSMDSGDKTVELTPGGDWGPSLIYQATSRKVSGKASCTFGVSSNLGNSLSQLGVTNPLSLAWELLPYSFVVDWFYPVGSFLDRLDYAHGLEFQHGWLSYRAKQEYSLRLGRRTGQLNGGEYLANWSGGSGHGSGFYFEREALRSFPPVPVPQFKDPFSLGHVANALSLLSQAFGR